MPEGTRLDLRTDRSRSEAIRRVRRKLRLMPSRAIGFMLDYLRDHCGIGRPAPAPVLGWDELRRLAGWGVRVASHTRTHPALPTLTREEIVAEISQAQADLTRELPDAVPLFSFPLGLVDPRADSILGGAGIAAAFVAIPGRNILGRTDRLRLRRRAVHSSRSFTDFSLNLISFYGLLQERLDSERGVSSPRHPLKDPPEEPVSSAVDHS